MLQSSNTEKVTKKSDGLKSGSTSTSQAELVWACSSMQGCRPSMENADFAELSYGDPDTHLFGVFDGHSSSDFAEQCAAYLPHLLSFALKGEKGKDMHQRSLSKSFLMLDRLLETSSGRAMLDALVQTGNLPAQEPREELPVYPSMTERGPGSTGVVCLMTGQALYVANVGNSHCVLCRSGTGLNLSTIHNANDERERTRVLDGRGKVAGSGVGYNNEYGACVLPVTRAFGSYQFKQSRAQSQLAQIVIAEPTVKSEVINDATDEFLVLACNGVFECLAEPLAVVIKSIRSGLESGLALDQVCEMTLDQCVGARHLGSNNMTLQVILLPTSACNKLVTGSASPASSSSSSSSSSKKSSASSSSSSSKKSSASSASSSSSSSSSKQPSTASSSSSASSKKSPEPAPPTSKKPSGPQISLSSSDKDSTTVKGSSTAARKPVAAVEQTAATFRPRRESQSKKSDGVAEAKPKSHSLKSEKEAVAVKKVAPAPAVSASKTTTARRSKKETPAAAASVVVAPVVEETKVCAAPPITAPAPAPSYATIVKIRHVVQSTAAEPPPVATGQKSSKKSSKSRTTSRKREQPDKSEKGLASRRGGTKKQSRAQ